MNTPEDPDVPTRPTPDEQSGPYRLADEPEVAATADRRDRRADPSAREHRDRAGVDDGVARDVEDDDGIEDEIEDGGTDGSLPPPVCRRANTQPWLVVAGTCAALLAISWLGGAPQLSLPDGDGVIAEMGFGERINGLARTLIFLPLAMLAAVFGLCALAFIRQRPIGDPASLFAKSLAIVCIASLVWLVPTELRIAKQALNLGGPPILAGVLAVPIFRLHPRDAAAATAYGLLGLLLIVGGAWVVVWATT